MDRLSPERISAISESIKVRKQLSNEAEAKFRSEINEIDRYFQRREALLSNFALSRTSGEFPVMRDTQYLEHVQKKQQETGAMPPIFQTLEHSTVLLPRVSQKQLKMRHSTVFAPGTSLLDLIRIAADTCIEDHGVPPYEIRICKISADIFPIVNGSDIYSYEYNNQTYDIAVVASNLEMNLDTAIAYAD